MTTRHKPSEPLELENLMQDGFLIDSDDPLQRGAGVDRLGNCQQDGLKYKWQWIKTRGDGRPIGANSRRERIPCQICEAVLPRMASLPDQPYIRLEVIFWHTNYEARLRIVDNRAVSSEGFQTRLAAQQYAERLVNKLATEIRKSGA